MASINIIPLRWSILFIANKFKSIPWLRRSPPGISKNMTVMTTYAYYKNAEAAN